MDSDLNAAKKGKPVPNTRLRRAREERGWSQKELVEYLFAACENEPTVPAISEDTISRWERGIHTPSFFWRRKLSACFDKSPEELGLLKINNEQSADNGTRDKEIILTSTGFHATSVDLSVLDLGVTDKLDSAESIINLAWEVWFASRPREIARTINKLLPSLEKIAYSLYPPAHTLRAKELVIRAHGLLGCVCSDSLQIDSAFFHYMQAHRFAEEIHDKDLTTTYLCLVGEVLRQQKDSPGALRHMENARDLASSASHATRGHILQLLAYAYGDTGQEAAFERTIAEATDLLAFSGEGRDIPQKEFIPFEVYEIRGKINRDLGKPLNALPYLDLAEQSLTAADSVTPRWNALLEISRAQAYCDAGDMIKGVEHARKGFIMAYQCRSSHQMNRVRKLLKKLENSPFRNHSSVQDLKNLLFETYMRIDGEDGSLLLPQSSKKHA